MLARQLPRLCVPALIGLAVLGLSNDRGSADVDPEDRKLEAFIDAAAGVDRVMAAWQAKIAHADDHSADALRLQANSEIRKSIEEAEGITLAEYKAIRRAIALDPAILARVTEIMRARHR
ncbi:MAG: hypothetical protein R3F54_10990 [Alphaproteobacteria bacterium]